MIPLTSSVSPIRPTLPSELTRSHSTSSWHHHGFHVFLLPIYYPWCYHSWKQLASPNSIIGSLFFCLFLQETPQGIWLVPWTEWIHSSLVFSDNSITLQIRLSNGAFWSQTPFSSGEAFLGSALNSNFNIPILGPGLAGLPRGPVGWRNIAGHAGERSHGGLDELHYVPGYFY
jgi:hypothetical protein